MKCLKCDCRSILSNAYGRTRVRNVGSQMPDCICEKVSVSRYSPSPVHDDETLLIAAFHPIHIDHDSDELKNSAITSVKSVGLSTFRASHSTIENIVSIITQKLKSRTADQTSLSLQGIIKIRAGDVRGIGSGGNRSFCIYDTALAENIGHAEIFQTGNSGNSSGRKERENFRRLLNFKRVQSIGELRNLLPDMGLIDRC